MARLFRSFICDPRAVPVAFLPSAARAAASRAIGMRNGEHERWSAPTLSKNAMLAGSTADAERHFARKANSRATFTLSRRGEN